MPRVEIRDPFGQAYRIDTCDQNLLRKWLEEWVTRLAIPEHPLMMAVYPLPVDGDERSSDWPNDCRFVGVYFPVPGDWSDVLLAMEAERDRIEREILAL